MTKREASTNGNIRRANRNRAAVLDVLDSAKRIADLDAKMRKQARGGVQHEERGKAKTQEPH